MLGWKLKEQRWLKQAQRPGPLQRVLNLLSLVLMKSGFEGLTLSVAVKEVSLWQLRVWVHKCLFDIVDSSCADEKALVLR